MKNNKGFTIVELMLALLIIGMVSTLVTSFLGFGYESFNVYSRYTSQQEKVQQAFRLLRKDINESKTVTMTTVVSATAVQLVIPIGENLNNLKTKTWFIKDGKLQYFIGTDQSNCKVCVDNLDDISSISKSSTADIIVLKIKPNPTNNGKYMGNNINKPLISEFSVKYKIH